jgi:hypothetical protein
MRKTNTLATIYTIILSIFLLTEGVWGLFSPVVFGVFTTNTIHAVIHIILGIIGFWVLTSGNSDMYCLFTGMLLLLVGIFRFVPGVGEWIVSLLNVNKEVAFFNIIVGLLSLMVAFQGKKSARNTNNMHRRAY